MNRAKGAAPPSGARTLATVIDNAAAVNAESRFVRACMALCDRTQAATRASRCGVGFLARGTVALRAVSHAERIDRKTADALRIEEAMNECFDQSIEVHHPPRGSRPVVSRAAAELAGQTGAGAVMSFPLRAGDDIVGVFTIESEEALPDEAIASVRVLLDLVTPRIAHLRSTDRWFGARAAGWLRGLAAAVIGPRHTWAKLAAICGAVLILVSLTVRIELRVPADAEVRAVERAEVSAPFAGRVRSVFVEVGDRVDEGEPLIALDTSEQRLRIAAQQAEADRLRASEGAARVSGDLAAERDAQLAAAAIEARISQLQSELERATPRAPLAGVVRTGDWSQRVGSPVELGAPLFEITAESELRIDVFVREADANLIQTGDAGGFAAASAPGVRTPFTVERVMPFVEDRAGKRVVRVRGTLRSPPEWVTPGMSGVVRIDTGRATIAHALTRRVVDWLRLRVWV